MGGLCTNQRFFVSKRDAVANGVNTKTHRQPPPHPSIPLAVNIYAEKNVTANPTNGRSRGTHTVLSHLHVGNFDLVAGGQEVVEAEEKLGGAAEHIIQACTRRRRIMGLFAGGRGRRGWGDQSETWTGARSQRDEKSTGGVSKLQ